MICRSCHQGCWVAVVRSRRFLGGVGVGFLVTLGVGLDLFVRLRLRMSNWIIFYITLLNWEFLLKWYNFFWNFCLKQRFLAVHHDFHWVKCHSLYVKESKYEIFERSESGFGVGNCGKPESGVGQFGKVGDGSDILPPTPQPWLSHTIFLLQCVTGAQLALHFGGGEFSWNFIRWRHHAYSTVVQLFRKRSQIKLS